MNFSAFAPTGIEIGIGCSAIFCRAKDMAMSMRFFFNVVAHRNVTDPFGLIRRDDAAAIDWAQNIADGFTRRGVRAEVIILREDGHQVARIATGTPSSCRFRGDGLPSPDPSNPQRDDQDSKQSMAALARRGR